MPKRGNCPGYHADHRRPSPWPWPEALAISQPGNYTNPPFKCHVVVLSGGKTFDSSSVHYDDTGGQPVELGDCIVEAEGRSNIPAHRDDAKER